MQLFRQIHLTILIVNTAQMVKQIQHLTLQKHKNNVSLPKNSTPNISDKTSELSRNTSYDRNVMSAEFEVSANHTGL